MSILLNPFDSRYFIDQGPPSLKLFSPLNLLTDHTEMRIKGLENNWNQRCQELESSFSIHLYGYGVMPRPILGKVDLAAIFFRKSHLRELSPPFFGRFKFSKKYSCVGCQDGYFVEHLVSYFNWKYESLPILHFSSFVFHGPSPLWCVAGGNVWFDHPDINQANCFSSEVLRRSLDGPMKGYTEIMASLDWDHFHRQGYHDQICIRLAKAAFLKCSRSSSFCSLAPL